MSLAALKRRLTVGTEIAVVENTHRPETTGHRRRVVKVQSNAVVLKPDEWDDDEMERRGGSWMYWPKGGDVHYGEGAETFTIGDPKGPHMTFRFLFDWELDAKEQRDEMGALVAEMTTCGTCGRTWNDALITGRTPAPSSRCPFEDVHPVEGVESVTGRSAEPSLVIAPSAWRAHGPEAGEDGALEDGDVRAFLSADVSINGVAFNADAYAVTPDEDGVLRADWAFAESEVMPGVRAVLRSETEPETVEIEGRKYLVVLTPAA